MAQENSSGRLNLRAQMKIARLRMVGGPNGSGKSTFVEYLKDVLNIPLGRVLNPDDLEKNLRTAGGSIFRNWGFTFPERNCEIF